MLITKTSILQFEGKKDILITVSGLEINYLNKLTELFTVLILVQFGFSNFNHYLFPEECLNI